MYGACIKALGLGGGGSNAINRMIQVGIQGVEFVAANTDVQALACSEASVRLALGPRITRGLGAGGDPSCGNGAARESRAVLAQAVQGADIVFLTAGMGGGTGTGSIAVAAEVAREAGALVIAIVTAPFSFEGARRTRIAREGLEALRPLVHTLIVVPNDRLLQIVPRDMPFEMAFQIADEALRQGVQGIAELITRPGLINLDFSNVRAMMERSGGAMMAMGQGSGEDKAVKAAQAALHHPLLGPGAIDHAEGLLIHITGGEDLGLFEVQQAVEVLSSAAHPDAEIMFGATIDPDMNERAELIFVATGVGGTPVEWPQATRARSEAARSAAPGLLPVSPPALRPSHADPARAASMERDDIDIPVYARRWAASRGC